MAIQVNGTTVIDNSRALQNITSVDATTVAALGAAGVGGAAAGEIGGPYEAYFFTDADLPSGYQINSSYAFFVGTDIYISAFRSGDGNARSLLKSTNYGSSWTAVLNWQGTNDSAWTGSMRNKHFAWDGGNNMMFVIPDYYGGVFRSTNGGASWSESNPFGTNSYPSWVTSAGNGYFLAGSQDKIYRTSNNGSSWSQIHSGTYIYTGEVAGNTFIGTNGSSQPVRSTNFKTGWSYTTLSSTTSLYYDGVIQGNGSGFWINDDGRYSTDDGVNWNVQTNAPTVENYCMSLINGYAIGNDQEYYAYSTDPANGWTYSSAGLTGGNTRAAFWSTIKPWSGNPTTYMSYRFNDNLAHIGKLSLT